jgi:hypothetical protein
MSFTTFICNIHYEITKEVLHELLIQITSIKSLNYKSKTAFVIYFSEDDQNLSYSKLNNIQLFNRRIQMYIVEPRTKLKVCVNRKVTKNYLLDVFSKFGSCKCSKKKGFFIIFFRKKDCAINSFKKLNNFEILGNKFYIEFIN